MNDPEKREALARTSVDLSIYDTGVQAVVESFEAETAGLKKELLDLSTFTRFLRGRSINLQIAVLELKTALYKYQSFAGKYGDPKADNIQDEIDRISDAIVLRYNLRDIHGEYVLKAPLFRLQLKNALSKLGLEELVD